MLATFDFQVELLLIMALAIFAGQLFHRLQNSAIQSRAASTTDYLYKIARLTNTSEYDIFRRSAEDWPVSEAMVKEHFRTYLLEQTTPYYVNAFVRKHKDHVDQLRLPPLFYNLDIAISDL